MIVIRIGFSRPKKWMPFAWLIMAGYAIPYDHVFVRLHSQKYQRDLIYQASKTLVNFMGSDLFSRDNEVLDEFEVEISDESYVKLMQFAIDNAGKPYGVKQAFGLAWVRINALFGRRISNPFKDGGQTYVCSELGAYVLKEFAGDSIPEDLDDVTPKELFDYLSALKAKVVK